MKHILIILAMVFSTTSFAAEKTKPAPAAKPAVTKKCDPLKQKDCKKDAPSANKPIPKKKAEPK